jgi:toxin ParE1/3/4
MNRARLSPQVRRDLKEIDEYISRDNPDAAARLISMIREKCLALSEQPGIGRNQSDLLPNLRSFPIGSYVIFYFPTRDGIEVVPILHGARDIERLFDVD